MLRPLPQLRARMLISDAAAQWFGYIRRFTLRTQEHYQFVLGQFVKIIGDIPVKSLRQGYIEEYITELLAQGLKNSTCNRRLTAIKSFCRWLSRNQHMPNHALFVHNLKEDPPDRHFLTHEQLEKVIGACRTRHEEHCIKFLAFTGLRASEAVQLTWDDIDDDWLFVQHGKGRKSRRVPLCRTVKDILGGYQRKSGATIDFMKPTRKTLYWLVLRIGRRVEIKVSPQILRRCFATELANRGVDLVTVSTLLGHSSVRTTEQYVGFDSRRLKGCTDVLDS